MLTIAHLIDDAAVGGINRALKDQTEVLQQSFAITQLFLNPRHPMPPQVGQDVAIVHFTPSWSKLPFLTLLRAQRANRPLIFVEHTYTRAFERHCVPNVGRFRAMLRLSYRLADKVVAVSHAQAEWMRSEELVARDKLVVIQQCLNYAPLLNIPLPLRRADTPLRLAAYGRYCRQKGFDTLIEAMRRLPPKLATLTLAGYGPDQPLLKNASVGMDNVCVGPPISDLRHFLAEHDIVVMPSRWEAFGLVCLEARAAGRPVLVADVDGLVEQVTPALGGIVSGDDPDLLAAAVRDAVNWNLAAMGAKARSSVEAHQSRYSASYTNLWNRIAANTSTNNSQMYAG